MSTLWRRTPDALWRTVLDEVVVLVPGALEPVLLGGLGAELWHRLAVPGDVEALLAELAATAGVAPEALREVVVDTLDVLAARDVVLPV